MEWLQTATALGSAIAGVGSAIAAIIAWRVKLKYADEFRLAKEEQVKQRDSQIQAITAQKESEVKSKQVAIDALEAEKKAIIKEKELTVQALTAQKDAELRVKQTIIDGLEAQKALEIRARDVEIESLKRNTPKSILENYDSLLILVSKFSDGFKKHLEDTQTQLDAKEREIKQLRAQGASTEALNHLNQQRVVLEEKQSLLSGCINSLLQFEKRMSLRPQAMAWISNNRERLVEAAVQHVLNLDPCPLKRGNFSSSSEEIKQFGWEVEEYLHWLSASLDVGKILPLEQTNLAPLLPGSVYSAALQYIQDKKATQELPATVLEELKIYTRYLITYFAASS